MGEVIQGKFGLMQKLDLQEASGDAPNSLQYWTLKHTAMGLCYIVGWFDDPKRVVVTSTVVFLNVRTGLALTINGSWYSLGQYEADTTHSAGVAWEHFVTEYQIPPALQFDPDTPPEEIFGSLEDVLASLWACSSEDTWKRVMNLFQEHNIQV